MNNQGQPMQPNVGGPQPMPMAPQEGFFKKLMRFWKKAMIVLVLFVVAIIGVAFFATRGVSDAADSFVAQLQSGDCDGIFTETSAAFQTNTTATDWATVCAQIGPILQGDPAQANVAVQTGANGAKSGLVTYAISGTDGNNYQVILQLVDEEGWKLDALDSSVIVEEDTTTTETTDETTETTEDTTDEAE